ncbi:thiamine-phosphate kinase [Qipengyuania sp. JC766]|uniref:thiamine-phosphate kinase n=1 Tax=Qipengyuania sp. JC766 TaxID=3232139 RepID=UPI00345826BB
MNETAFIAALRSLDLSDAARNLEDDAAVLEIGGETLVVTHDSMVEGIHFLPGQDPADVAWKLVATNLSDLAAKGAMPVGVLLSYMLGDENERFIAGLRDVLAHFEVPLIGGDTVRGGPPRTFGLTAIGRATSMPVPARSGARPGDALYLCGNVGAAMMEFEALENGKEVAIGTYRRPHPLLAEGAALAAQVTAMMDVSDGLLLDASRIARASGVTIDIATESVPIEAPANRRADTLRWGDDYALLFTLRPGTKPAAASARIGRVLDLSGSPLLLDGKPPADGDALGYIHH